MGTSVQAGYGNMATDLQMTELQNEATGDSDLQLSDEVEELSKSLREVIQDQTVQPKLQCLMMDPSFSMVTVQSEDSSIMWETSFSPCSAPWMSAASTGSCKIPASKNAGKIIFIMDEAHTVRKKRAKKEVKEKKTAKSCQQENTDSSQEVDELIKRPAMVEVSTPNVKDEQNNQSETTDLTEQKEQRLFRLVSEGTEILNIVVPPKVATVDEEESKELVDNLAYMEESSTVQPLDVEGFEKCPDPDISEPGPAQTDTQSPKVELQKDVAPILPFKAPPTGPAHDSDYCNVFTLYDRHSTEVTDKKEEEIDQPQEEAKDSKQALPESSIKTEVTSKDSEHPICSGEISIELLDDVFYGGTEENNLPESVEECQRAISESSKSSRKESGGALFVEEDEVLTPIFLPEGPPKIIDPILLEEPKAMAFLYTDLYEEAVGTRKKDEDAVSLSSEKSFHSKQSDTDDKVYFEKFVLKDETPSVEKAEAISSASKKDGSMWSEDVFELAKLAQPEEKTVTVPEEEVTDFFRDSNSSSPCEKVERPNVLLEESIDNRCRQVKFKEEATPKDRSKSESEQAPESTLDQDPEKDLDATILAELEELHIKQKSPADDMRGVKNKPSITDNKALVNQQSITKAAAETPLTYVEQQATDKPVRPFLGLSSLQPIETEGDLTEGKAIEKGEEG
ncbi:hypothetical protein ACEWY4_004201 [Coilia grayii]|uniref:Cardiomyopathy-associated protein 5 n=1 Tax=Coilia grayii TaxID=363190 RepID=A0ABD1KKZ9_9TELE